MGGRRCEGKAGRESLVAEVFRRHGGAYLLRHEVSREQRLAIVNIARCRTEAMGGHLRQCPHCGYTESHFNSCRDRHCPRCQWMDRVTWTVKQQELQLPVPLFMVTFTVPSKVGRIGRQNPETVFGLTFRSSNRTLQELAASDGLGSVGVISVLHTWSRKMEYHPHVHNMVTAGGFDGEKWNPTKPAFLFAVARIRALYRKHMLQGLHQLYDAGKLRLKGELEGLADPLEFGVLMKKLWTQEWIVDVQAPRVNSEQVLRGSPETASRGNPEHAIKYLATYTRSVAISDHRMVSVEDGEVTFRTRDSKTLTLGWEEFIRRFLLHVLPSGFHKVRYYGLYSNSSGTRLEQARAAIIAAQPKPPRATPNPKAVVLEAKTWEDRITILTGIDPRICPRCKREGMVTTEVEPRTSFVRSSSAEDTS